MTLGSGALVVNADNDSHGTDGTFTMNTGKTITNTNQAVTITPTSVHFAVSTA